MRLVIGSNNNVSRRLPAPALFISAALVQYVGAGIAVTLFDIVAPSGVVWWRMAAGAAGLVILWRPWRAQWTRQSLLNATIFGVWLAAMNLAFYEAIARIPLGTAVSVEFVGPVAVAVLRGKGARSKVSAALAFTGVVLIGGWGLNFAEPQALHGFLFALLAATAWAGYILMGSKLSDEGSPGVSLALGLTIASLLFLPFLGRASFDFAFSWGLVAALVAVGLLSTTVPYSIDSIAFGRLNTATFALLTALLPATSTLVGLVMLRQVPSLAELVGLGLVSGAVWLASREDGPQNEDGPERAGEAQT